MRLLTLDLWDTVLLRCCHAEAIWLYGLNHLRTVYWARLKSSNREVDELLVARRQSTRYVARRNWARGADQDADLKQIYLHMLPRVWRDPEIGGFFDGVATALVALEVSQLIRCSEVNEELGAMIDAAGAYDQMAIVSDFYLPASMLCRILVQTKPEFSWPAIFSSCEMGATKRSGRLFRAVYETLGTVPKAHVHIGDDAHSDYRVPKALGIDARLYTPCRTRDFHSIHAAHAEHPVGPDRWLGPLRSRLEAVSAPERLSVRERALFRAGTMLSPLLASFVFWVARHAIQRSRRVIHYLAGAGDLLIQLHAGLRAEHLYGVEGPRASLLRISPRTAFASSLEAVSVRGLEPFFCRYGAVSPRMLFVDALGLDPTIAEAAVRRAGADFDQVVHQPLVSEAWQHLLGSVHVYEMLDGHVKDARSRILEDLRNYAQGNEPRALVDIVGDGFAQDGLAQALPQGMLETYYLYDSPTRHVSGSCEALSFVTSSPWFRMPERLLRRVCGTSQEASVVSSLAYGHSVSLGAVRDGVLAGSDFVFEWLSKFSVPEAALPMLVLGEMSCLMAAPPPEIADVIAARDTGAEVVAGSCTRTSG